MGECANIAELAGSLTEAWRVSAALVFDLERLGKCWEDRKEKPVQCTHTKNMLVGILKNYSVKANM